MSGQLTFMLSAFIIPALFSVAQVVAVSLPVLFAVQRIGNAKVYRAAFSVALLVSALGVALALKPHLSAAIWFYSNI